MMHAAPWPQLWVAVPKQLAANTAKWLRMCGYGQSMGSSLVLLSLQTGMAWRTSCALRRYWSSWLREQKPEARRHPGQVGWPPPSAAASWPTGCTSADSASNNSKASVASSRASQV